ncbi:hypothetical protein QR98_0090180 [Sarcoptes scabiei]|uniref:Uncharacterized protein n=1 Tax=Sarcoptes scabiei TaxID=52283 RepID=A0A132AHI9_SARSC|nr:hypothetical protein QR98_0090180 [Sarcoptes scabiei]
MDQEMMMLKALVDGQEIDDQDCWKAAAVMLLADERMFAMSDHHSSVVDLFEVILVRFLSSPTKEMLMREVAYYY